MTNKLFQAYSNTLYKVFEPSLCIKIGEHNPTLDSLLEKYGENEYAYLTAYNPFSEQLAHAKNNQRHQQLKEDLTSYQCFEGEGCGEDPTWPCERSYLVLGISKEKAIIVGNRYGQNAIVYGRRNLSCYRKSQMGLLTTVKFVKKEHSNGRSHCASLMTLH